MKKKIEPWKLLVIECVCSTLYQGTFLRRIAFLFDCNEQYFFRSQRQSRLKKIIILHKANYTGFPGELTKHVFDFTSAPTVGHTVQQ